MTLKSEINGNIEVLRVSSVCKMQKNKVGITNMAESAPLTIQQVFDGRPKWRATNTAPLTDDIKRVINEIRMEVNSGATADGWNMAGAGRPGPHSGHGYPSRGGYSPRGGGGGSGSQRGYNTHGTRSTPYYESSRKQQQTYDRKPISQTYSAPAASSATGGFKKLTFFNSAIAAPTAVAVAAPAVVTAPAPTPAPAPMQRRPNQPRFTNSNLVKDDSPREKMFLQLNLQINKLANDNYDHLKKQVSNFLKLGEDEYLTRCTEIIFNAALSDKDHCDLFAKLLFELSQEFMFLQTQINAKFEEFIATIFSDIEPVNDTDPIDVSHAKIIKQKKRQNYSKFITELLKFNVIEDVYFLNIIKQIIDTIRVQSSDEKYQMSVRECAVCLKIIVEILCDTNEIESYNRIRKNIKDTYHGILKEMAAYKPTTFGPGIPKTTAFLLLETYELLMRAP